jgi:hypothetical protein
MAGLQECSFGRGRDFSPPERPDRFRGFPNRLSDGYEGRYSCRSIKLTRTTSAGVRNTWIYIYTRKYAFMAYFLIKHRYKYLSPFLKLTKMWDITFISTVEALSHIKKTPWSESASELYRPTAACRRSDCQPYADRGCHVVSVTDPSGRILGILDRSRYFSIK